MRTQRRSRRRSRCDSASRPATSHVPEVVTRTPQPEHVNDHGRWETDCCLGGWWERRLQASRRRTHLQRGTWSPPVHQPSCGSRRQRKQARPRELPVQRVSCLLGWRQVVLVERKHQARRQQPAVRSKLQRFRQTPCCAASHQGGAALGYERWLSCTTGCHWWHKHTHKSATTTCLCAQGPPRVAPVGTVHTDGAAEARTTAAATRAWVALKPPPSSASTAAHRCTVAVVCHERVAARDQGMAVRTGLRYRSRARGCTNCTTGAVGAENPRTWHSRVLLHGPCGISTIGWRAGIAVYWCGRHRGKGYHCRTEQDRTTVLVLYRTTGTLPSAGGTTASAAKPRLQGALRKCESKTQARCVVKQSGNFTQHTFDFTMCIVLAVAICPFKACHKDPAPPSPQLLLGSTICG